MIDKSLADSITSCIVTLHFEKKYALWKIFSAKWVKNGTKLIHWMTDFFLVRWVLHDPNLTLFTKKNSMCVDFNPNLIIFVIKVRNLFEVRAHSFECEERTITLHWDWLTRELSFLFSKMKEPENPEKNTRLQESVEEDYGYPLYPERKNPELYKEYTMIGRRSVKVIEKQTVKCFTHCESEFPRRQHRVLFFFRCTWTY